MFFTGHLDEQVWISTPLENLMYELKKRSICIYMHVFAQSFPELLRSSLFEKLFFCFAIPYPCPSKAKCTCLPLLFSKAKTSWPGCLVSFELADF